MLIVVAVVAVVAVVVYGIYDIVSEVKGAYTSDYSRTYSRATGMMMSHEFDSLRLSGKGIKMGVLDAGFGNLRTNRWTKELHIGDFCDFTGDGVEAKFFEDEVVHGTTVCSNIGGFSGDTLLGLACNATYYLAKTDRMDEEPRSEEQNMIRGIEWLLAHDVDIISSSLGYTNFDDFDGYTSQMLDGGTSVLSGYIDSVLTAHPRLIFVQSAGNEGNKEWKYIIFPSDVRKVITVGATSFDGKSRYHSSGIGREDTEYIKPDFAAHASPIGTSFSTPIITGLCACALEYQRMERDSLIAVLHDSGTRASNPNREVGYGTPQTDVMLKLMRDK